MKTTLRKALALLLCLSLCLSFIPTAFAEDELPEVYELQEDVSDLPEVGESAPGFEQQEQLEYESDWTSQDDAQTLPDDDAPEEVYDSDFTDFADFADVAEEPVEVIFASDAAALTVTVHNPAVTDENGDAETVWSTEEGVYLLLPGYYLYDASADGYESENAVPFEVFAGEAQEITVRLNVFEEDGEITEPENSEGTQNADADFQAEATAAFGADLSKGGLTPVRFYSVKGYDPIGLRVYDTLGAELEPASKEDGWTYLLAPGLYGYSYHDTREIFLDLEEESLSVGEEALDIPLTLTPIFANNFVTVTEINPLYDDIIDESDLEQPELTSEEEIDRIVRELIKEAEDPGFSLENEVAFAASGDGGEQLRAAMVSRQKTVTVTVYSTSSWSETTANNKFKTFIQDALSHTGNQREGDTLRYEYNGCECQISRNIYSSGRYRHVYTYTVSYYTTASQESSANSKVNSLVSQLSLSGMSDAEKISTIHCYLYENVTYDYDRLNDDTYKLKFSGYAALVNNCAVCQGYAVAFYRLCLAAGVEARVVTSEDMNHAWNIVKYGNKYYELDATWDSNRYEQGALASMLPHYFLRGSTWWQQNHKANGYSTIGDQFDSSSSNYDSSFSSYVLSANDCYVVSYNANGGSGAPARQIKTHGVNLTLSSTQPTRSSDIAESYTVTLNANGGSVSTNSLTAARTTSYTFKNWNTASGGGGTSYASGGTYTNDAPATMYAQWNSSTTTASVTLPTPTRSGYTFNGWATSSSATSGVTGSYTPSGNVTLYAVWLPQYTVSYDANGGSGAPASQTKTQGVNLTLSTAKPTRSSVSAGSYTVTLNANGGSVNTSSLTAARTTSYTFKYWNTASGGGGTSYASGGTYTANASATLYAQWNSNTTTAAVTLPTPTRDGYTFKGWATSSSATSGSTGSYTPSGNVTLYAVWEANKYTISYNANGGSGAPASQTKTQGVNLTLSTTKPTRADASAGSYTVTLNANDGTVSSTSLTAARTTSYTFNNWNTAQNGAGTSYASGGTYTANASATLYAQWDSNTTTAAVTLPTPTRDGYTFKGWATSSSVTSGVTGSYTPSGDVTLYAVWENTVFASGTWYDLTWTLDNEGLLTISGNGKMTNTNTPWESLRDRIKSVVIESGVTSISNLAFWFCWSMTSVTIPSSVTRIGDAFNNCWSLTSVTIPSSVTSIDGGAFWGCRALTDIYVEEGNTAYCDIDGVLFNKTVDSIIIYPGERSGEYTIPSSVTSIGVGAFNGCSGLTSVTIPEGVTRIGSYSFCGCSGLTSVTIPSSVTSIGNWAFYDCSGLTSVTIPEGVTSIGDSAFDGCSGLTSVTIPSSVTSIGDAVFEGCDGLIDIHVEEGNTAYCDIEGVLFNKTGDSILQYPGGRHGEYIIPSSVTSIGKYAFYCCTGLTSVTIPSSVTSIGDYVFKGCSGLTDVYYGGTQAQWNQINIGSDNTPLTSAVRHYAAYTVTYSANGGNSDSVPEAQTKTPGEALTLSSTVPTREGYDFLGWATSATATEAAYQPGGSFTTDADTTLYAVWTENALTLARSDYNAAVSNYFDGTSTVLSDAVQGVEAADLSTYAIATTGLKPRGCTRAEIALLCESDNCLRVYFDFDGTKDLNAYSFAIDGETAALEQADGKCYLELAHIAPKDLDTQHSFSVTYRMDTFTVNASALSYAWCAVNRGSEAARDLGKALYLYNRAADNAA